MHSSEKVQSENFVARKTQKTCQGQFGDFTTCKSSMSIKGDEPSLKLRRADLSVYD